MLCKQINNLLELQIHIYVQAWTKVTAQRAEPTDRANKTHPRRKLIHLITSPEK